MSSTNDVNSGKGSMNSQNFLPTTPAFNTTVVNPKARTNIKLPIFNGNGLEDPEKHWLMCDDVWTVQLLRRKLPMAWGVPQETE